LTFFRNFVLFYNKLDLWKKRGIIKDTFAHVAQSVEHILGKDEVAGSIPAVGLKGEERGGIIHG
jgi:hypothetical protein